MEAVINFIHDNIVWGLPSCLLILAVGIFLTIKFRGLQFLKVGRALKCMVKNEDDGEGEVSTFGALCISMAATLGTGKIVGVAIAIAAGGPGALFWMILAAIFGMATKYCEGFLAIRFRKKEEDGSIIGGPFMYIENGLGKKFKWLAILFAIFGAFAGLMGTGTMTQMDSINTSVISVFDPMKTNTVNIFGNDISIYAIMITIIVTICAAFAVIGGVQRISKMSTVLVPIMAIIFFLSCLGVVVLNIQLVPSALLAVIKGAFTFKAGAGAAIGFTIMTALQQGISRGIFSNEAGLGSAPIAIASAKSNDPVEQGLVCMGGTFIDTMVLCLTIGLGIVMMGSYTGHEGLNITIDSFAKGLHIGTKYSAIIVMFSIVTFAFTTIIGWNVYGEKCIAYLTNNNKKAILIYKILYVISVAITPFLTLEIIWTFASIANGLMAIPNLIALLFLGGLVARETRAYFKKEKDVIKENKEQILETVK